MQAHGQRQGVLYALAAYVFWGIAPVYFVWVSFAEPLEVLAQRIVWSVPLLALLMTLGRQWRALARIDGRQYLRLGVCSLLLSINWLTFIYAIHDQRIAETSLGYFINPLVTIILGWLFLGERMLPLQWAAAACAATGLAVELLAAGTLPLLGLLLALSFGLYGLVRKQMHAAVPAALALGIETLLVTPLALAWMVYAYGSDDLGARSVSELGLLALGGLVTVLPLVCFGAAAARLSLTLLGFIAYLAPSLSLLLAVSVYGEQVAAARWVNLSFIWTGLLLFSAAGMYHRRSAISLNEGKI